MRQCVELGSKGRRIHVTSVIDRHTHVTLRVNHRITPESPHTPNQTDFVENGSPHCSPGACFARRGVPDAKTRDAVADTTHAR